MDSSWYRPKAALGDGSLPTCASWATLTLVRDQYVFRVQKDRIYYVLLSIANLATSVSRDRLLSVGTCLGKITKTGKVKLHITALPILAEHCRYKIWVKVRGS